jgi:ribosomal protein S18 acetylase RimI-like enzyme
MNNLSSFRKKLAQRRKVGKGKLTKALAQEKLFERTTPGDEAGMYSRQLIHTTREGLTSFINYSTSSPRAGVHGEILIKDARKKIITGSDFMQLKKRSGEKYFYVSGSITKPSYRREGLQRQVIEELKVLAKKIGVKSIRLDIEKKNVAAIEARKKIGFRPIGVINPILDAKNPIITMELEV